MTPMTWEYVAGFFDGEGCVGAPSGRTGVSLGLTQKSDEVLRRIKVFFEGQGIACSLSRNRSHPAKMHTIHICSHDAARRVLEGLRPFVIVKKQAVEDAWRQLQMFPRLSGHHVVRMGNESRHWSNRDTAIGRRAGL